MPSYRVIRPFIDRETGQRREPGEMIEADAERGGRMLAALVVTAVAGGSRTRRNQPGVRLPAADDAPAPETAMRAAPENAERTRGQASS